VEDEERDDRDTQERGDHGEGRRPTAPGHLSEAEDNEAEANRTEREARNVESTSHRFGALLQIQQAEHERGDTDGDSDEEDETPRRVGRDDATEDRAQRGPENAGN